MKISRLTSISARVLLLASASALFAPGLSAQSSTPSADEVCAVMKKATQYMLSISTEGGYLYNYSPDLKTRSGEQYAADFQIWIQPPGTPAMGEAFLRAYAATKDSFYLDAARRAATSLVRCQLPSKGWNYSGSFSPKFPNKDGARSWQGEQAKNGKHPDNPHYFVATTFDDDNTQCAVRFLMKYAEATADSRDPQDAAIKASLERALQGMLEAQYPNGAWPQRYNGKPRKPSDHPALAASYPSKPVGKWPDADYTPFYTLNDNVQRDCIFVMFEAHRRYKKPEYLEAALSGAEFILKAQMPAPQRGWAQQYDFKMQPVWARVFEPPALASMETRSALNALLEVYLETGDEKYLKPIDEGIDWLKRSALGENVWSRFYSLKTNKPLYCDNDGNILLDIKNARKGYNWQSAYKIPEFFALYKKVMSMGRDAYLAEEAQKAQHTEAAETPRALAPKVRPIMRKLDDQGRWITQGSFKKFAEPADMISTHTFITNMNALANYLEALATNPDGAGAPAQPSESGNPDKSEKAKKKKKKS